MPKEMKKRDEALPTDPVVEVPKVPVEVETVPMITFDQWFLAKQYKPHWKLGMVAFTDTSGRKTFAEWDRIFAKY